MVVGRENREEKKESILEHSQYTKRIRHGSEGVPEVVPTFGFFFLHWQSEVTHIHNHLRINCVLLEKANQL